MNPSSNDYTGLESTESTSALPLAQDDWVNLGAGAALLALGTGRVTLGGLVRFAALAAGGLMVYRTVKETGMWSRLSESLPSSVTDRLGGQGSRRDETTSASSSSSYADSSGSSMGAGAYDPLRARGEVTGSGAASGTKTGEAQTGLAGAEGIPAVDLRGA